MWLPTPSQPAEGAFMNSKVVYLDDYRKRSVAVDEATLLALRLEKTSERIKAVAERLGALCQK